MFYLLFSSRIQARQECTANRKRDPRTLPQVKGDIPVTAHPLGVGSPAQDLRRHTRPVLRPAPSVRVWRIPPRVQLLVPGRLRGQREAVAGDDLPTAGLQDQIPRKLFPAERQPRMRLHKPYLRVLRRVQATLQHQAVEDVHGLFQLPARSGHR